MLTVTISRECLAVVRSAYAEPDLSEATALERVTAWLESFLADEVGALNPKTTSARRDAALDAAFGSGLNSGFLRGYDGTQPTDADTALGAQVKLFECTLNATAFAASSGGSKAANAITADSAADATGTCTWGTIVTSAGTRYMDFSAGTAGCNLNLNTASIVTGAQVTISSFTVTQAP